MALWYTGIMQRMDDAVIHEPQVCGIDWEASASGMDSDENLVPENSLELTQEETRVLKNLVPNPPMDDGNSGIDLYVRARDFLENRHTNPRP